MCVMNMMVSVDIHVMHAVGWRCLLKIKDSRKYRRLHESGPRLVSSGGDLDNRYDASLGSAA